MKRQRLGACSVFGERVGYEESQSPTQKVCSESAAGVRRTAGVKCSVQPAEAERLVQRHGQDDEALAPKASAKSLTRARRFAGNGLSPSDFQAAWGQLSTSSRCGAELGCSLVCSRCQPRRQRAAYRSRQNSVKGRQVRGLMMPGRPFLATVFSCCSLRRACFRPLRRDFQAWGPSRIRIRMPRTAQRWFRRPARASASTGPGSFQGRISQVMRLSAGGGVLSVVNDGLSGKPGRVSPQFGEWTAGVRSRMTMPRSDQRRVARSTERTAIALTLRWWRRAGDGVGQSIGPDLK